MQDDAWREIPYGVLDQDKRQQDAQQWGAQARAELAQEWGQAARDEITQQYPDLSRIGSWASGAGTETAIPSPNSSATLSPPSVAPAPNLTDLEARPIGTVQAPSRARANITDVSQFGQADLTYDEALAACGPAAAVRLASLYGNNIPLKAALDAAKQVGWTSAGGMNGITNEKRLLDSLGIPAVLDTSPDLAHIISDAQSGNPVTISTPNHYFTASGYDAQTGKFFVGESGKVYRGGGEWLSFEQIRRLGGGLNGALFVDAPTSPQPSIAALDTGQTQAYEGQPVVASRTTSVPPPQGPMSFDGLVSQAQQAVADFSGGVGGAVQTAGQTFQDAVSAARQAVGYTPEAIGQSLLDKGEMDRRTVEQAGQFTTGVETDLERQQRERNSLTAITPAGVPDIGSAVTEGLNRAGLPEANLQIGPLNVGSNALIGFGAGMVQPTGEAGAAANVTRKVAGEAAEAAAHGLTINLPKYVPEEVRAIIQRAYDANPALFDEARRGVISDDAVRELADQAGTTVNRIVSQWKPGQAKNAETILALREGLNSASQEVISAQRALRAAPDSADALNAVTEALTKHAAVQEAVTGVTAEAGRALRQFRQPVTGQQFAVQQLQRIAKATKMDPEELAKHLAEVDLTDPAKVANLARTLTTHSFGDKLSALWYFSLLSSPVTHIKNTLSNAIVLASRPVEATVSAIVDVGRAAVTRSPRERYFGEAPAQIVGMRAGLTDGVRSAYQIMRRGFSEAELSAKPELATSEAFRGRLADLTVNVPGRLLRASDVFFRSVNKTASIYGDAYRMASRAGLKGQALADEAARLVANPTKEMLERAETEGAYRVFQQDGTFVRDVAAFRQNHPAVRYLLPFIQTPYNIAKYALERSPVGLVGIAADKMTGKLAAKGAGDLSDRLGRVALGSATMGALVEYARQGNLTGAAPIDQADKDAFYRQGKQPYSMRNPVTGEWFSYAGLQPFTTIFSAATEMEKMQRSEPGKPSPDLLTGIAVTGLALGRATLDQPWTDGLAEFLDFMSGSNVSDSQDLLDTAGKYAARQSRVLVPAVVRWLATATDTTIREPERGLAGIPQTLASGVPGFQDKAPAKLTAFGLPSQRGVTGAQTLNPLASSQPNNDPVEQELARLQLRGYKVEPGFVGKTITVNMADQRGRPAGSEDVELTSGERNRYQQAAGMLAHEFIAQEMASPDWGKQDNEARARIIDRLVANARRAARAEIGSDPALMPRANDARRRSLEMARP